MTDPDFARLRDAFLAALEHDEQTRARFVAERLADAPELLAEALRLLRHYSDDEPTGAAGQVPAHIGPYELLRPLGAGGMGVVYLAEQRRPVRRLVALKLMRGAGGHSELSARFQREREVLAMLSHDGIARLLDAGTSELGEPWFAMEYVEGRPILAFADEQRLAVSARIRLLQGACDAVHYAHERGVIHRDIKPANVLVRTGSGGPTVKVIDFGIARLRGALSTDDITQQGAVLGTPRYMAPEQAGNAAASGVAADVFALGVLLRELLVGRELGRGRSDADAPLPSAALRRGPSATDVASLRSTTVGALLRELRGGLDRVVARATDSDPSRRYASVADLSADLRRHLLHEPVLAVPPSTVHRVRKFVRRHPRSLAGAASLAVAGAIALYLATDAAAARRLVDRREATTLLVDALLAEETDASLSGAAPVSTDGRRLALDLLERASALAPDLEEAVLLSAALAAEIGDRRRAESTLRRVRGSACLPLVAAVQRYLASCDETVTGDRPRFVIFDDAGSAAALNAFLHGRTLLRHGAIDEGIRVLERATYDPVLRVPSLYLQGEACLRQGGTRVLTALTQLAAAQALAPGHPTITSNLCAALCRFADENPHGWQEYLPKVLQAVEEAVVRHPDNGPAWAALGNVLHRAGKPWQAVREAFTKAIDCGADSAATRTNLANTFIDEGNERAREGQDGAALTPIYEMGYLHASSACRLDETHAAALVARMICALQTERTDEARALGESLREHAIPSVRSIAGEVLRALAR